MAEPALYLRKGAVAPAPAAGDLAIVLDTDGVTKTVDSNGVKVALGGGGGAGGDARMFYGARASVLLGSSNLAMLSRDFSDGTKGWSQSLVGTGGQAVSISDSTDAVNSIGGVTTFTTGSGTTGSSELFRGVADGAAGFAPWLASADPNIKFYCTTRFQMSSTIDANVACGVGCRNWLVGAFGANSATKFSLRIGTAGFHYITSTIAVDTAFHILETWHDGVNAWLSVDGETPISLPDVAFWPLTAVSNSFPLMTFAKASAVATVYSGAVNWVHWAVKPIP